MKAHAAASKAQTHNVSSSEHSRGTYLKVNDGRKRRIRGLWQRNDAFYAQLTLTDEATGRPVVRRVRLEDDEGAPVTTVADAVMGMNKLKVKRQENPEFSLAPKRTPTFQEFATEYLTHLEAVGDAKRPATIRTERSCLNTLKRHVGDMRLRQINLGVAHRYIAARKKEGVGARSVNLELVVLRNVLRRAVDDKLIPTMPLEGVSWLSVRTEKRRLVGQDEIARLCAEATATTEDSKPKYANGQELSDFITLMAYSGGRWSETLRLRWKDVDFDRRQLTFGGDGLAKNHEHRALDFNAKLEAHLEDMKGRRQPDSAYLFPSPRRGKKDAHTVTFNKTLVDVREAAGVPDFTCHLCRHYFISTAVMNGIDFMTIARWVGHKDGGILVGKVYGHLSNEHARRQGDRLTFGPVVLNAVN